LICASIVLQTIFFLTCPSLQSEMLNLFQSYSSLIKSSGAGDKVFALLDRVPPPPGTGSQVVRSSEDPVETVGSKSMSIKLENVHFSYPSRPEHPVLNGVELTIGQGQTIALVGPSGCGKSTLVNLLQRFYDPSHGRIYIDNADIKTLDVKELR
jgi:ABC-type multidrug transport system fused ATPase/permease subunit